MDRSILFITGKDVHNKNAFHIYKECIFRNFSVDVYATTFADNHVLLFEQYGEEIKNIEDLNESILENYDYIFSALPLFDRPLFRILRKYIFLNPSTRYNEVYFSGDFIFTVRDISNPLVVGEHYSIEDMNYHKTLPAMAAGGAAMMKKDDSKKRNNVILFIDAGHFPFGTKVELAEFIIEIANKCKNYELRVKPRYLPEDINTSHKNQENVITVLETYEQLPNNLTIIRKHTDLQKELEDCELVICSEGTSSYEEAILSGKKLLIFTGFPCKENELWCSKKIELFNKIPFGLKNRVYYKDIFEFLPEGIDTDISVLKDSLYCIEDTAKKIVDAMEYIYQNFISMGNFPKRDYYKIDNYKNKMMIDPEINWNHIIQKRYKTLLYDKIGFQISRLCININCEDIIKYIEEQKYTEENIYVKQEEVEDILYDIYINNRNILMDTAFSQSLLCLAYLKKGKFDEFKPENIKCIAYYNYCLAKLKYEDKNYIEALNHINLYFEEVDKNLYEISYADNEGVKNMAYYFKGAILYQLKQVEKAKEYLLICDKAWGGQHRKAKELLGQIKSFYNL